MTDGSNRERPFRILLVEDSPEDQELAGLAFRRIDETVEFTVAEDGKLGVEELESCIHREVELPDLALADLSMPRLGASASSSRFELTGT